MKKKTKKKDFFKRLENIKDANSTQLQVIKDKEEQQLRELKNISRSKNLEAINEIGKKAKKQIKYCLTLRKQIINLKLKNLFVQKLMGLNTNLIFLRFH